MGAGLLTVKSGFILFIKSYQFPLQINTLERERERDKTPVLYLARLLTNSPCVMTTEVPKIRQSGSWFSHTRKTARGSEAIGNKNQLRPRPGQSSRKHSFGKRVRGVMRDKVLPLISVFIGSR
jgi:hypothetical protein